MNRVQPLIQTLHQTQEPLGAATSIRPLSLFHAKYQREDGRWGSSGRSSLILHEEQEVCVVDILVVPDLRFV